jgi:hypothetical protein
LSFIGTLQPSEVLVKQSAEKQTILTGTDYLSRASEFIFGFWRYFLFVRLRNKSWKPECVGSFNMDWRILVFYPQLEAREKIY